MERKRILEIIGISCAGLGLLLTIIFTILSCNFSADNLVEENEYTGSLVYIVVVVAMLIAIAGGILALVSMTKGEKPSIFVIITFACVFVTLLLGIIPHVTICAYNCSIESTIDDLRRGY